MRDLTGKEVEAVNPRGLGERGVFVPLYLCTMYFYFDIGYVADSTCECLYVYRGRSSSTF